MKFAVVIDRSGLDQLLADLKSCGFETIGPRVRDGAIVYDTIDSVAQLPAGWGDEQDGGKYRLRRRDDDALFGHVVGPHSWNKYLFPPAQQIFRARRDGAGFVVEAPAHAALKRAFIGVRSCELHAMAIQDRVFLGGEHREPAYAARRENVLIVAVNCGVAGGTCFCVSRNTGPRATAGFDIALTEMIEGTRHVFLAESGSSRGAELLKEVSSSPATPRDFEVATRASERAASAMGRQMDATGVRELLLRNLEHPRWDDVAARCLSCANCTMACPTCFCTTVEDVTDLTGDHAERWRKWDSCFTTAFTHTAGGAVRTSVKSRYRQWLTHKLATWHDQFGSSGCVGCGRCITWCPVGIDLTEEVRAIRESETAAKNLSAANAAISSPP